LLLANCSGEIPFPAVHDLPPPRTDITLTPDEVKKATSDLNTDRDHLSTEAQSAAAANAAMQASMPAIAVTPVAVQNTPAQAQNGITGSTAGARQ
jgi:hypothetical protein